MSDRPTPETDAELNIYLRHGEAHQVSVPWIEFARKLERERDEAREDAAHWKSEWEIVEARLCGWKHPRDNGITFEHEIIPVLRKERDEAREQAQQMSESNQVLMAYVRFYRNAWEQLNCATK